MRRLLQSAKKQGQAEGQTEEVLEKDNEDLGMSGEEVKRTAKNWVRWKKIKSSQVKIFSSTVGARKFATRPVISNSPFFRTQTHFPWIYPSVIYVQSFTRRLAIHYQVSYQDSRAEERGAVGRKESSQAPENRDRYSTPGRQRLHMQQL